MGYFKERREMRDTARRVFGDGPIQVRQMTDKELAVRDAEYWAEPFLRQFSIDPRRQLASIYLSLCASDPEDQYAWFLEGLASGPFFDHLYRVIIASNSRSQAARIVSPDEPTLGDDVESGLYVCSTTGFALGLALAGTSPVRHTLEGAEADLDLAVRIIQRTGQLDELLLLETYVEPFVGAVDQMVSRAMERVEEGSGVDVTPDRSTFLTSMCFGIHLGIIEAEVQADDFSPEARARMASDPLIPSLVGMTSAPRPKRRPDLR